MRSRSAGWWIGAVMPAVGAVVVVVLAVMTARDGRPGSAGAAKGPAYVDGATCIGCHPLVYEEWRGSHHDLAMQEANAETVLGDFDDASHEAADGVTRFRRGGDGGFLVETIGPDGEIGEFRIAYAFGIHPLQQYLVELPGGRYQCLPIAWDVERGRWFDLYPDETLEAGDAFHWTGTYQNWNVMCAECHSTDLRRNYDPETDRYATTFHEIDVGCQACHGPGGDHVAWAQQVRDRAGSVGDPGTPASDEAAASDEAGAPGKAGAPGSPGGSDYGLLVDFKGNDSRYQVDRCAPCHSRRHQVSPEDEPGRPYYDDFMPTLLSEGMYHADGQILDEVYVYGSFLQSRMYAAGVRCTDCHDPHSLRLRADGDAVCMQCHSANPPVNRFPTLSAGDYATRSHHGHSPRSSGARCVGCHMPMRVYMQIDERHDHRFGIPRPDLSVETGVPNACTRCHRNRDDRWAAASFARMYTRPRGRDTAAEIARAIAGGRVRDRGMDAELVRLARDETVPGIVRATMVELAGGYGAATVILLRGLANDGDPLVRAALCTAARALPVEDRAFVLSPLLSDELRAVRSAAARALAAAPGEALEDSARRVRAAARAEVDATLRSLSDTPSAWHQLGVLRADGGDREGGEAAYRRALELDPGFLPAGVNLAMMLHRGGRLPEAEEVFRSLMRQRPDSGDAAYMLGLLLAETGRLEEASAALADAARLLPRRGRVVYNYALSLQHLGRTEEAEVALLNAHDAAPDDAEIVGGVAVFYAQQERWNEAAEFARRLRALDPGSRRASSILSHPAVAEETDR